ISVTYNGSSTAPTNPGNYAVTASISDPNYQGSASGTFLIVTIANSLLTQVFPGPAPDASGSLRVTLLPSEVGGQWRFGWERGWRNSGGLVTNLTQGNYELQFRP